MVKIKLNKLREGVIPGPKPVALVTCGEPEKSNIITVSYVGQLSNGLMYVGIRPSRYSNRLIRKNKKFGINYMDTKFVKEVDYCGLVSGRDVDKFKITKFTKKVGNIGIPLIEESPLSIEYVVDEILRKGEHNIFIGEVRSIRRREIRVDWLFHNGFKYFGKNGSVGNVYEIGKRLINI